MTVSGLNKGGIIWARRRGEGKGEGDAGGRDTVSRCWSHMCLLHNHSCQGRILKRNVHKEGKSLQVSMLKTVEYLDRFLNNPTFLAAAPF